MPKLLAISHSAFDPASRFRVMQLLPYFRAAGWASDHRPIRPSLYWQPAFRGGSIERLSRIAAEMQRRISSAYVCGLANRYDVVLVNRELPYSAGLLLARNPRVIFDFDDAIYLGLMAEHVAWLCERAACTVVGNEVLADTARRLSPNVVVIPTLVDTDAYKVKAPEACTEKIRVAWLGSEHSIRETLFPYLDLLAQTQATVAFQLVIISRPRPELTHRSLDWKFVEWSPDVERNIADHAEIGIMPLQDTVFQRAKCGTKLLQYMAAGLPSVASPFGINTTLLKESGAEVPAETFEEWSAALGKLCADARLRSELGFRARAYCVQHYSVRAWLPRWLETLQRVSTASRPPATSCRGMRSSPGNG